MEEQYLIKTVHEDIPSSYRPRIEMQCLIATLKRYVREYGLKEPSINYRAYLNKLSRCGNIDTSIDPTTNTISFAFEGKEDFLILKVL